MNNTHHDTTKYERRKLKGLYLKKKHSAGSRDSAGLRRSHRIEIRCDGELILAASSNSRLANHDEMVGVLRELIAIINAPSVPDLDPI